MSATQSAATEALAAEYLSRARSLVQALECEDPATLNRMIGELTTLRETQLYRQADELLSSLGF